MSFRTSSVLLIVMVLSGFGVDVYAQPKLSSALISTNVALDGAQQRELEDFAGFWVQAMLNTKDPNAKVSEARDQLVTPLRNPSAGSVFKTAYSATLLQNQHLPLLLESNQMLVRFNAMLCVPYLVDKAAIPMVQQGLLDTNPAIRYLAAQAAGKLGQKLEPVDQMTILSLLNLSFFNEPDQVVVEQLLGSMGSLTISQAREALLDALNRHINVHHGNPNLTLKADRDAMQQLLKELVTEQTGGKDVRFQVSKKFAIAACRFMVHCSAALDEQRVYPTLVPQYTTMVQDCERILIWISTRAMKMDVKDLPAEDVAPNIRGKQWTVVRLRAEDWRKTLQLPPYNTFQRDLAVPSN